MPRHMGRGDVIFRASSGSIESDWRKRQMPRVKQRSVAMPFLQQQSLSYGRYLYQEESSSSEDSDVEFGSSRQQLVGFCCAHFVETIMI